jgi:Protein of unknown function (DUF2958)
MMLLTKAQRELLLDNGRRQAAVKGTPNEIDFFPVVKLFDPRGAATWLLTEIDPEDETVAWGLCDLFEARGPISAYIDAAAKVDRIVEDIDEQQRVKGGAP